MAQALRISGFLGLTLLILAAGSDSAVAQTMSLDLGKGADSTGRLIQIVLLMTVLWTRILLQIMLKVAKWRRSISPRN